MSINLGNNTFYEGQIIDGKKYGFGRLIKDGNLLYEGMWIDDKKIDDIPLPNEVPPNTNMETCQKLKFSYNSKNGVDNFDLTFCKIWFDGDNDSDLGLIGLPSSLKQPFSLVSLSAT